MICNNLPTAKILQKRVESLKPLAVSLYLVKGKETSKSEVQDLALYLREADKLPALITDTVSP